MELIKIAINCVQETAILAISFDKGKMELRYPKIANNPVHGKKVNNPPLMNKDFLISSSLANLKD